MVLSKNVDAAIVSHARQAAPEECCGLLLGNAGEIVDAFAARNIADDPARRYLIDPRDHLNALRTTPRPRGGGGV